MNKLMKIKIKKRYLIFREDAKKIEKISQEKLKRFKSICFDFSNVEFVSRSFLDELLNILAKEKRIKILNLNANLKKFFNLVKKTKERTHQLIFNSKKLLI